MNRTKIYIIGLCLLTSCYSFDKEVAIKEFKELKPNCEVIKVTEHECDGTLGECWYVEFKYKHSGFEAVHDTTIQFWKVDNKWIIKKNHISKFDD